VRRARSRRRRYRVPASRRSGTPPLVRLDIARCPFGDTGLTGEVRTAESVALLGRELVGLVELVGRQLHVVHFSDKARIVPHTSMQLRGSSPVVASSSRSRRGDPTRLTPRSRQRRWPPEYVRATRSATPAIRCEQRQLGRSSVARPSSQLKSRTGDRRDVNVGYLSGRTFLASPATLSPSRAVDDGLAWADNDRKLKRLGRRTRSTLTHHPHPAEGWGQGTDGADRP
jgi:hypothetical protein